jgi:glyoxylase-like metal-dependent hydrolase (beta-lactamase superfamily II)
MILETIEVGGCRSYILGCPKTHVSAVIDPEISAIERYRGLAARHGLALLYAIDTHTHADSCACSCSDECRLELECGRAGRCDHA